MRRHRRFRARNGVTVVATHPVQCAAEEDYDTLEARRAIAYGWMLDDRTKRRLLPKNRICLTPMKCIGELPTPPAQSKMPWKLPNVAIFLLISAKTHLPSLQLPNNDDSDTALALQAKAGLGEQLSGQYESRLAHELEVIQKMGFADYFLIVADFVNWAKKQGVPVGPGRGSGAGSLVAYALNITTLDPIKHKLLFERFLIRRGYLCPILT